MGNKHSKEGDNIGGGSHPGGEPPKENIFKLIGQGYGELVNGIIRPPRAEYDVAELGPKLLSFRGRHVIRTDFEVVNQRGLALQCSHWQPASLVKGNEGKPSAEKMAMPCLIYLHGNASCRAAAQVVLPHLLPQGISVMSFDFAGSGLSQGEYVSLGFYEKHDVTAVVAYLRGTGTVSTIGLWGHSMGAATALMFAHTDPSVAALVLDCAFADLQQLAMEMVRFAERAGYKIPKAVAAVALAFIKGSVQKKAKFDINAVKPIKHVHEAFIPALFALAKDDELIDPHHSRDIYAKYGSEDKNLIEFAGTHSSQRPRFFFDSAVIFLKRRMCIEGASYKDTAVPEPDSTGGYRASSGGTGFGFEAQTVYERQLQQAIQASLAYDQRIQDALEASAVAASLKDAAERSRRLAETTREGVDEAPTGEDVGEAPVESVPVQVEELVADDSVVENEMDDDGTSHPPEI